MSKIGKRTTIVDVATKAGVSKSVVSYVLNDVKGISVKKETASRIKAAAEELNYIPNHIAKGMRMKRSSLIGLVSFCNQADYVFMETLEGVQTICKELGYNIVVCVDYIDDKRNDFAQLYERNLLDGIIFVIPALSYNKENYRQYIDMIDKHNIPACIINGMSEKNIKKIPNFSFDYASCAYEAVRVLKNRGYEHISYLLPNIEEQGYLYSKQRLAGYLEAMDHYKLKIDKYKIITMNDIKEYVTYVKDSNIKKVAVVANKAKYAVWLYEELKELGIRIPEDITIISANDVALKLTVTKKKISGIGLPIISIASAATIQLINAIENKNNKTIEKQQFKPIIHLRDT